MGGCLTDALRSGDAALPPLMTERLFRQVVCICERCCTVLVQLFGRLGCVACSVIGC